MEDFKSNKYYKLCLWGFILSTIVYLIYATITMRGMYLDSSFVMLQLLDSFANNQFAIFRDLGHPRFLVWILTQIPLNFANFVLCIHNKYALMMIYSFLMLAFPLFLIFLHYKLAIRTKRLDLYFLSLFVYCVFALPFSIFCYVESPCVATLIFILINYLVADIDYTKTDIFVSALLSVALCVSAEFYIFVGPMIVVASLFYVKNTEKLSNIGVKLLIGILSFLATMFMLVYVLLVPGEFSDTMRFLDEGLKV